MTVKWEKQEGNKGTLTFEVPAEQFDEALDQAFKKVVKDIELPGFRKGRIPRGLFEQRFGVESLYQDAVDIVLQGAYSNAVQEADIFPIIEPEVDIEQIEKGKDLILTAEVEVKPEVTLGEYKGLEIEEETIEVTDEDVEKELETLREQHAELVVKDEGEIAEGDTVVIDFEGFTDGEAFEGGKGENHNLEIGSGQFIPGFEEKLIGKKPGEETAIDITFPEEYHAADLAGKDATFEVKIHEVKQKELPELDDEFAKDVDEEAETLDELKEKKKEQLLEDRKQAADTAMRDELIEKAVDNVEVDVPDAMVETELNQMLAEFEQRLQMQGMTLDMYAQFSGQDEDALKEQMKEDAAKRVKTSLTLEAIANEEKLEATDEEVNEELENMAGMYGVDANQLVQILGGNTETIKNDLKVRKAIDLLVEDSKKVD